jgi:hypothetical protein
MLLVWGGLELGLSSNANFNPKQLQLCEYHLACGTATKRWGPIFTDISWTLSLGTRE